LSFLSRLIPAAFFAVVCVAFWMDFVTTRRPTSLAWMVSEGLVVVLFVVRRTSADVSRSPADWIAAVFGTIVFLLVRPSDIALAPQAIALTLQMVGLAVQVTGKITLGRSFGAVAANRGVVTGGPYRIVRHPIYLGYLLSHIGFILANFSIWNMGVYAVGYALQIIRILAEERLLITDAGYREYRTKVRYRFIPGVF
jgi:protein-S-isoprenylcysteine O-methyltransferase Ste14